MTTTRTELTAGGRDSAPAAGAPAVDRRTFLRLTATLSLVAGAPARAGAQNAAAPADSLPDATARRLPRWRGFNLLAKFTLGRNRPFRERDFALIAEWGLNFARLPMDYRCWTPAPGERQHDPRALAEIDQAVDWGRQYGVHVSLNFHRAPGYCVNPPAEPLDLWQAQEAQDLFAWHWSEFAARYRGIPSRRLSFNLVNEPAEIEPATYVQAVRPAVSAIRDADPDRLIIADGIRWGTVPVPDLAELGVAQSTRGYQPTRISHYRASWMSGSNDWPEPTWPLVEESGKRWDRATLRDEFIRPWQQLQNSGVGVHVGEWGAYQQTPHGVVLAWMRDQLELWREAGFGWALWNLDGSFGVLNSGRADVAYEEFRGAKLDRAMLELLLSL